MYYALCEQTHNSYLTTHTWKYLRPLSRLINSQKYKQQYSKAPQRRPSIAKKGQGNAYDGCQTQHHANIDYEVEDEYTGHPISIYSPKDSLLPFGKKDDSHDKNKKQNKYNTWPHKALLLANGAENEVSVLLWHIF